MDKNLPLAVITQEPTPPAPASRGRTAFATENEPTTIPDDSSPSAAVFGGQEKQAADECSPVPAEEPEPTSPTPATRGMTPSYGVKENDPIAILLSEAATAGGQEEQAAESAPPSDKQESLVTIIIGMCLLVLSFLVEFVVECLWCLGQIFKVFTLLVEEYVYPVHYM